MNEINQNSNIDVNNIKNINLDKYQPYLYQLYYKHIVKELMEKFNIKNIHQVPKIKKIIITSGISRKSRNYTFLEKIFQCLYLITGQLPIYTKANKSISQFKIYKKCYVGVLVCLNNKFKIFEFIEKLGHIYLNYIKNFKGIRESSIKNNNFNIGIKDVHIFPEISQYIGMEKFGLNINIILEGVNNNKDKQYIYLLNKLDIPIYD